MQDESSKAKLIKEIRDKGSIWDAVAQDYAFKSVRDPDNDELKMEARKFVALCDHANKMASEIIQLIHNYWD